MTQTPERAMDETHEPTESESKPLGQPATGQSIEPPARFAEIQADTPAGPMGGDQSSSRPQRTVPYGALAEERARRKELQRELQSTVEARQRLQGRLDLLHELVQQRAAPNVDDTGEPVPEPSEPQGEEDAEAPSGAEPEAQAQAQAQADETFRTQVMQSVREIMRERPDFLAAYQHARQARVSELRAVGYAPQEALQITFENELEVIRNAYANGRNPALIIYDYARRHGYRDGAPHGVSSNAPAASPSRGTMNEAEKVALAARGQATSKSLSMAGGGSIGTLTLEALAGMSDEEFAEATKGERWQRLLS